MARCTRYMCLVQVILFKSIIFLFPFSISIFSRFVFRVNTRESNCFDVRLKLEHFTRKCIPIPEFSVLLFPVCRSESHVKIVIASGDLKFLICDHLPINGTEQSHYKLISRSTMSGHRELVFEVAKSTMYPPIEKIHLFHMRKVRPLVCVA